MRLPSVLRAWGNDAACLVCDLVLGFQCVCSWQRRSSAPNRYSASYLTYSIARLERGQSHRLLPQNGAWPLVISPNSSSGILTKKCPLLSTQVHSCPFLSHSKSSARRVAKNACYNYAMRTETSSLNLTLNRSSRPPLSTLNSQPSTLHAFSR